MGNLSTKLPIGRTGVCLGLLSGVAVSALLGAAPAARAAVIPVIDVIPNAVSAETGQNSEPSIAVDPLNPNMMISGAFSSATSGNDLATPYWISTNGGTIWTGFGTLPSSDKSLAWEQSGAAALTTTLNVVSNPPPQGHHQYLPKWRNQFWLCDQYDREWSPGPAVDTDGSRG